MAEIEKKVAKLIKYWIAPNIIETLIVIVVFLLLPKDPKNAWLLGYSKSRMFIVGGAFLYTLLLFSVFISLSSATQRISGILQKIKSYPSTDYAIEIICGVCLLLLYVCGFYFFRIIPSAQTTEAIHIRLIPLVAYFSVFIIQLFVFLILFGLILGGEKFTLKKIWLNATLPMIRGKVFDKMDAFITFTAKNFSKKLLTILFIFTPAILTTVFIRMFFTTTIFSHIPAGSDERHYWHETMTFIEHGFSGGQYSHDETPAQAEFSHFGLHGPAFPVIYGLLGRVFGWEYYTGALINLILITLALWIVALSVKLNKKQLVSGSILVGTFWPILLYIPSIMTESLNHAIAMFLSVLFYKQLNSKRNKWQIIVPIFLILFVSMTIRTTWSLLFLPFFLLLIFDYKGYKLWGAVLLSAIGMFLGFLFTKYFYPPYRDIYRTTMSDQLSIQELLQVLWTSTCNNVKKIFIYKTDKLFYRQAFRYQMTGFAIYLIAKVIRFIKKGNQAIKKSFGPN